MRRLLLIFLIALLAGCRTFEIGIVQTPTPDLVLHSPTVSATLPATATIEQPTAEPIATTTIAPTATRRAVLRPTSTPIEPSPTPTLPPPRIISFTVEPLVVNPGETVTLRWSVANGGDSIDIDQRAPDT